MFKNVVLAMAVTCGSAFGVTTYAFDFGTAGSGNTWSLSGLSVSASAFYTSSATAAFSTGTVGQYTGAGLGICQSATESTCTSPEHQLDNVGRFEFMLFKFSTPVSLSSIRLINYGGASGSIDRDMTYYTSTSTAASITLGTLNNLGNSFTAATTVLCPGNCSGTTSNNSISGTGVTYLLVGAAAPGAGDGTGDYFKINSLTVTTGTNDVVISPAPEPSTVEGGLLALAGIGWYVRRRRSMR
jgi:hypothetical protein